MRRPSAATEDERVCNRNSKSWRRGGAKWRDRCGPDGRHDATNPTLQLAASRSGCCAATADNSRAGLEGWRALQLSRLRQPAVRLGSGLQPHAVELNPCWPNWPSFDSSHPDGASHVCACVTPEELSWHFPRALESSTAGVPRALQPKCT